MLDRSVLGNRKRRYSVFCGVVAASLLATLAQRGSAEMGASVLPPSAPISIRQVYCAPKVPLSGTGLSTTVVDIAGKPASTRQWSGWLKVPAAGRYGFVAAVPGVQVLVRGQDVSAAGSNLLLDQDRFHAVRVVGPAHLDLKVVPVLWTPPSGPTSPVPTEHLFPPVARVAMDQTSAVLP
jgi:hypothetical protein